MREGGREGEEEEKRGRKNGEWEGMRNKGREMEVVRGGEGYCQSFPPGGEAAGVCVRVYSTQWRGDPRWKRYVGAGDILYVKPST